MNGMYCKKPIAITAVATVVVAITLPALLDGKICAAPPRAVSCDAPGLIVVSTNTSTAASADTLGVVENVTGEMRQAPTPEDKFRQYVASKLSPAKRPS